MSTILSMPERGKCQGEKLSRKGQGDLEVGWGRSSMSNGVIRGRLTEVMFEQRPEERKRPRHTGPWRKRIPDRKNSKYNGSEAHPHLGCSGKSKEAGEAGVQRAWERVLENKVREVMVGTDGTLSHRKALDFSEREKQLLDRAEWRRILI